MELIPKADTCVPCLEEQGDVSLVLLYRDFSGSPEDLEITDTWYYKTSSLGKILDFQRARVSRFPGGHKVD